MFIIPLTDHRSEATQHIHPKIPVQNGNAGNHQSGPVTGSRQYTSRMRTYTSPFDCSQGLTCSSPREKQISSSMWCAWGWAEGPYLFTSHLEGQRWNHYLDDWLLAEDIPEVMTTATSFVLETLTFNRCPGHAAWHRPNHGEANPGPFFWVSIPHSCLSLTMKHRLSPYTCDSWGTYHWNYYVSDFSSTTSSRGGAQQPT